MDADTLRGHAEAHARAMVDGDLRRAGADLTPEAQKQAPEVMKQVPNPVHSAQVNQVSVMDDGGVTMIVYAGGAAEATVEAHWQERDGRPMIVSLKVV